MLNCGHHRNSQLIILCQVMVELLPLVRTIQIHNLEEIENVLTIHSFYIQPTAVNNLYRLINDNLSLVELIQTNLSTKPFLFTYFPPSSMNISYIS